MMDKSAVCPFLFDIKTTEINGPILQFQTTSYGKDEVEKLMTSLNKFCGEFGLKEAQLKKSFEVWWPSLQVELDRINKEIHDEKTASKKQNKEDVENMLEEILTLSRANQKLLRSPETLFPQDYLSSVIQNGIGTNSLQYSKYKERLSYEFSRVRAYCDHFGEVLATSEKGEKPVDKDMLMEFDGICTWLRRANNSLERLGMMTSISF